MRAFKAGDVRLDIRELPAADVIGIAVSVDRQEQQNILKLKSLGSNWRKMVDLIYEKGLQASDEEIGQLLGYRETEVKGQICRNCSGKKQYAKYRESSS